jgi:hypothetical protein
MERCRQSAVIQRRDCDSIWSLLYVLMKLIASRVVSGSQVLNCRLMIDYATHFQGCSGKRLRCEETIVRQTDLFIDRPICKYPL